MDAQLVALSQVWEQVARNMHLDHALPSIASRLAECLPICQVVVRGFDTRRRVIETLAVAALQGADVECEAGTECSQSQMDRLLRWCRQGRVIYSEDDNGRDLWRFLLPRHVDRQMVAGPLSGDSEVEFSCEHLALSQELCQPLSVALSNDHRFRELNVLREAAEAEKRSLLARLGRERLGDTIVGTDTGLRGVMERVRLVARSDAPVLLLGETGTGKELIARAIHIRSPRAEGPLIRVNCGAIPPELVDSQLFGHERGAFTGAEQDRKGWFERADGGTLFLDEIGELPFAAQVRLLRVLQDGWLERVGGEHPIHVDVRVVAATHRDLAAMVSEGRFREDLWYRISVFPIILPPLRERPQDIPELARHFAKRAAIRYSLPLVMPTPDDIALLTDYPWPGNVRELAAVIDRAAILGDGRRLEVAKALGVTGDSLFTQQDGGHSNAAQSGRDVAPLDVAMRQHIETALAVTAGRIEGPRGAAALLQINPHTLRARMRKLGIDWRRFRKPNYPHD